MKKSWLFGISLLLILSLMSPLIWAAENDTATGDLDGFPKAYDCLENLIVERGYDDLTSEELSFSLLALAHDPGFQGNLRSTLADSSNNGMCWPGTDCNLKDTSIALIALNHIAESTNSVENYLIDQTIVPDDLVWYLQVDTNEESDCTIVYEGGSKQITVEEDKRISGSGGSCFRSALGGYWLEIDEDCYDEEFEISCETDFITSITYKKKLGSSIDAPYYVSSLTHSAPAESTTREKISSLCFEEGTSNDCDYEGTLWATLAMKKLGKDTAPYMPYLIALASNNEKYLPSAFLYLLTGEDSYFTELANEQKADGYWQATSDQNKRYYDTALALLALQGRSAEQATKAHEWVLETQQASGCWRNARDTSFILYAADPKEASTSSVRPDCADAGFFCVSSDENCEEGLGEINSNYYCQGLGKTTCCSVDLDEEVPDVIPTDDEDDNECEERGYFCQSFCSPDVQEIKPYSCEGLQDCCGDTTAPPKKASLWWVWLLVLLIILLVLAIIYRNQLKVWLFKVKNKFSKKPVTTQTRPAMQQRPPARPGMPGRQPIRPPVRPGMPGRPPARPGAKPFPKQKELNQTLNKLKKINK